MYHDLYAVQNIMIKGVPIIRKASQESKSFIRFKAYGADSAMIEPFASNIPIQRACQAVGFERVHTISRRGKWLNRSV